MKNMACPVCHSSLSVTDEMGGRKVRCPKCLSIFVVKISFDESIPEKTAASLPLRATKKNYQEKREEPVPSTYDPKPENESEKEDDWEPYPPRLRLDLGWKTVQVGLRWIYYGVAASLITMFLGLVMLLLMYFLILRDANLVQQARGPNFAFFFVLLIIGSVSLVFLGIGGILLANLVGLFLCASSPEPRGRGFAGACIFCLVAGLVFSFFQIILSMALGSQREEGGLIVVLGGITFINNVISLGGMIFLVLFLQVVARFFDNEALAKSCTNFLIFLITWWAFYIVATIILLKFITNLIQTGLVPALDKPNMGVMVPLILGGVLLLGSVLILVLWYLRLVQYAGNTITQGYETDHRRESKKGDFS